MPLNWARSRRSVLTVEFRKKVIDQKQAAFEIFYETIRNKNCGVGNPILKSQALLERNQKFAKWWRAGI